MLSIVITTRGGLPHGADGICARRSAAIPDRPIILPDRGLTMDQTPVARPLALSSSGVTTSARSLVKRKVNGSCRAATTVMPFVRGHDRWPVRLPSGRRTQRSRQQRRRALTSEGCDLSRANLRFPQCGSFRWEAARLTCGGRCSRHRVPRTAVARHQIRGGVFAGLRKRRRGTKLDRPIPRFLQSPLTASKP